MDEEILVSVSAGLTRVALLAGGLVQELHMERADSPSLVGNLYLGRVQRIVSGMDSAFIDIGIGVNGLLAAADLPARDTIGGQLCAGQELLVQVTRDALGDKGPRLTTAVTLASRHLVLATCGARGSVSRRIRSDTERQRLRDLLPELVTELGLDGSGLIARTAAENVSAEVLRADARRLAARWLQLRTGAAKKAGPHLVLAEPPLPVRVLRDCTGAGVPRITVDDSRCATDIRSWCRQHPEAAAPVAEDCADPGSLFRRRNVEAQISAALAALVPLPSGGNLVIERTEAMTTVDVNTGTYTGHRDLEQTLLQTNLEAAAALPRQLRLRALGGIVAVDFIDLREPGHRRAVRLALEQALAADPDAGAVSSVGKLGLVILSRRQSRPPLTEVLTLPCAQCGGSGRVPRSAATGL
ncbi:Rne/Rng family ribonuclease [Haliea sp. E1-2-M8]|uniref:Rne/Rng family ribonuclease n=1 Tax=Haliea sp. E1-2-M8 TaxID=3064706 RepID=UPI00271607A4|nr:Rne/Rng family ribonuclease [Haliea sp. E1-2-M8]MDO8861352.1 Rne/Rng family ribonuclease [Haliea sp. E1-2-M8]